MQEILYQNISSSQLASSYIVIVWCNTTRDGNERIQLQNIYK